MHCRQVCVIMGIATIIGLMSILSHSFLSETVAHVIFFIMCLCVGGCFAWYLCRREIIIRENEVKLQGILESIRDYVFVLESDGRISYANPAAFTAIGVDSEEQKNNLYIKDVLSETDMEAAVDRMKAVIDTQRPQSMRVYELHAYGDAQDIIPAEIYTVPFEEHGVKKILGVARPITDRVQLEAERMKIERLHSIGLMAGGIAHDFNNILSAIIGFSSLLQRDCADEKVQCYLSKIIAAGERATGLTQQLLAFSKGGTTVKKTASVADAIREAADFSLGANSHCRCEIDLPEDLWFSNMDYKQICQVIQNLVINASHAMPLGGVIHINGKNVQLGEDNHFSLPEGNYVHFFVKDSGVGIPSEHLPRIFDPYFTTKGNSEGGSGLGLSISHTIIKKHGGCITVNSRVGNGTTFHVYLPAVLVQNVAKDSVEDKYISQKKRSAHVLVIDDFEENRQLFASILKALGHSSVVVEDGQIALRDYENALIEQKPFDLIITDLTIPGGMGGVEFSRQIKRKYPQTIVIATSGYSDDFDGLFDAFISKPFTVDDVARAIDTVIL